MSLFKTLGNAINEIGTAAIAAAEQAHQRKVDDLRAAQAKHAAAMEAYIEYPGQYSAGDLDRTALEVLEAGRKLMTANHHWAEPATFNSSIPTMSSQAREQVRPRRVSVEIRCSQPFSGPLSKGGPMSIRHMDDQVCRYCEQAS